MDSLKTRIDAAVAAIRARSRLSPTSASSSAPASAASPRKSTATTTFPTSDIPHFPRSTVDGHAGKLIFGRLGGKAGHGHGGPLPLLRRLLAAADHLPVRVMKALGVKMADRLQRLRLRQSACTKGDLMIIEDHINLMGDNPLIGPNDDGLGPRFPDMSEPYAARVHRRWPKTSASRKASAPTRACTSPSPARTSKPAPSTASSARIGADVVGMSTVPEVIVAVHAGLKVFGVGIITDMCLPDALEPVDIGEIIAIANAAEPRLSRLMERMVERV